MYTFIEKYGNRDIEYGSERCKNIGIQIEIVTVIFIGIDRSIWNFTSLIVFYLI